MNSTPLSSFSQVADWKRLLHSCVILTLVFTVCGNWRPSPALLSAHAGSSAEITLHIDTFLDSNDPTYQVCSPAPDDCSLRGAISKANQDLSQSYSLGMPAGVYGLSLAGAGEEDNLSGDLDIWGDLSIHGSNATTTIIGGNALDRVLHIHPGARVEIRDLTIMGGRTPNSPSPNTPADPGG